MNNTEIKKTIKKIQLQENPVIAFHDELMEINDHLIDISDKIKQPEKIELKPVIKAIEDENGKVVEAVAEAVKEITPEFGKVSETLTGVGATLAGVGKVLEELAKIRGSKFLGVFKDENELPQDAQEGDYAILENKGELWYV